MPNPKGRPPNTPNKINAARQQIARQAGFEPDRNFMVITGNCLSMAARYQPEITNRETGEKRANPEFDENKYEKWMRLALDANNKAAPYFIQRLAAVHHIKHDFDLTKLSDAELKFLIEIAERDAATRTTSSGEVATRH